MKTTEPPHRQYRRVASNTRRSAPRWRPDIIAWLPCCRSPSRVEGGLTGSSRSHPPLLLFYPSSSSASASTIIGAQPYAREDQRRSRRRILLRFGAVQTTGRARRGQRYCVHAQRRSVIQSFWERVWEFGMWVDVGTEKYPSTCRGFWRRNSPMPMVRAFPLIICGASYILIVWFPRLCLTTTFVGYFPQLYRLEHIHFLSCARRQVISAFLHKLLFCFRGTFMSSVSISVFAYKNLYKEISTKSC